MTKEEMLAMAARLLHTKEDIELKHRSVDENTLYVYEDAMGGWALLIDSDGGVLCADSSIPFSEHLETFRKGLRNSPNEFEES